MRSAARHPATPTLAARITAQIVTPQLPLMSPSKALARQVLKVHETAVTIGYFLIGAHAAVALFHHYVMKGNALLRILSGKVPN